MLYTECNLVQFVKRIMQYHVGYHGNVPECVKTAGCMAIPTKWTYPKYASYSNSCQHHNELSKCVHCVTVNQLVAILSKILFTIDARYNALMSNLSKFTHTHMHITCIAMGTHYRNS